MKIKFNLLPKNIFQAKKGLKKVQILRQKRFKHYICLLLRSAQVFAFWIVKSVSKNIVFDVLYLKNYSGVMILPGNFFCF
jgi:hypothetical protein